MQLGIVSYCIPVIALGPILQIIFDGSTPKIILAALFVFFTTLVGMLVGLRSAEPVMFDVVRGYGGGRVAELREGAHPRRAARACSRRCASPLPPRSSVRSSASTSVASRASASR